MRNFTHSNVGKCVLLLAVALFSACTQDPPINRVDVNVVDKAIFKGSWYLQRTVIDVDYEAAGLGTFPGDSASDYAEGSLTAIPRIRWVIDEDFLYAYRDYQIIEGIDGEVQEAGDVLGQPVAAFAIQSHFDIRRSYNAVTGEEFNTIEENTTDRNWYNRKYMRVDWSSNLLPGFYGQTHDLREVLGQFTREGAESFVQEASVFPDSWKPQFHYMSCDGSDDTSKKCKDEDRQWADDYDKGELFHMSFVNQEVLSPAERTWFGQSVGNWCYYGLGECTSTSVFTRSSYLKVSDSPYRREEGRKHFREYSPVYWGDERFERHGYFRVSQRSYDRSVSADDPRFGFSDFMNYNVNRHNIWKKWFDDDGNPLPYADREVRQIVWYTTPELPAHLMRPSVRIVSQWNEPLMATVRHLQGRDAAVYPRIDCQTDDPDAYCYCQADPLTNDILNPSCPGVYDPFETPEEAEERGVENPYNCHVVVPEGAEPDMSNDDVAKALTDADFNGWFGAEFVGDECVQVLKTNTCNRASIAENDGETDGLQCQERGDARFKFISYVDQPGTRFLGIATLRSDPITGEIMFGDANIGGPALDGYRTRSLQQYDVLNGNLTEEELVTGEDVRAYVSNLNNVQLPAPPRTNFSVALQNGGQLDQGIRTEIQNRMEAAAARGEQLRGPDGYANTYTDRLETLKGTVIEKQLTSNMETFVMAGMETLPEGFDEQSITEDMLEELSPLRRNADDMLADYEDVESRLSRSNMMMPNEYVDNSVQYFVNKHEDWPRARLEFTLNRLLYFETQLHEMGHCMGLRHDFGGTADTGNYYDDYYLIDEAHPLPDPDAYDMDGTPGLSPDEQVLFEQGYEVRRARRELAGIDQWMNSSVMDYTANWYERTLPRAGRYDFAAIAYAYGDIVEVYDNEDALPAAEINPVNTQRVAIKYYQGGEACEETSDCPFAEDGARSAELLQSNLDSGLTQTCNDNPSGFGRICSNFDADAAELDGSDYDQVAYRFCSDERAAGLSPSPGTIGWCNRFDEGDSYREIVRNVAEAYERSYLWTNFRRYRNSFNIGGYIWNTLIGRQLIILQNVYQNLMFQYTSNPAFRDNEGPFGFYDEFLATADVLNLYARILASPDIGGYVWSDRWQRYQRATVNPDDPGAQLKVPIGLGRYRTSVYQSGLSGIQRIERIGTFYDKLMTIQLLASRGGRFSQTGYTRDLPFFSNFYDIFPLEMQQIFNGMIREFPEEYMPRVRCGDGSTFPDCFNPRLIYMDFYRGDCTSESSTCRPPPQDNYKDEFVINGGANFQLQFYAAIYGLAQFPTFFDTTFQNQLFVCVEGNGECQAPSETAVLGTDYVRFTSERYGKTFLAWQITPSQSVENQTSIGFAMVKEADDLSFALRMIEKLRDPNTGDPDSGRLTQDELNRLTDEDGIAYVIPNGGGQLDDDESRIFSRVRQLESFFNQLIQLQRQYGIFSYLNFRQ